MVKVIEIIFLALSLLFLLLGLLIIGALVGGKDRFIEGLIGGYLIWMGIFFFILNLPTDFLL